MLQSTGPLCPGLYELLRRAFGDVLIANEGEEVVIANRRWNAADGRTTVRLVSTEGGRVAVEGRPNAEGSRAIRV